MVLLKLVSARRQKPISRFRWPFSAMLCTSAMLVIAGWCDAARGDPPWREEFEGPTVSWRQAGSDMSYRLEAQARVRGAAHAGQGSEQIRVSGSNGFAIYFGHAIPPARVTAELAASVWIKADRPGLQILGRVVLPHLIDPKTQQPATVLIRSDKLYSQVGVWEQLRLENANKLFEAQVRVLQRQLAREIDPREAYLDQVWLNVYGGPGATSVLIDDLEVSGIVSPVQTPRAAPAEISQPGPATNNAPEDPFTHRPVSETPANSTGYIPTTNAAGRPEASLGAGRLPREVRLDQSVLLVDGRPFFPRMLRYHGESLAFLAKAGFNTIRLSQPPAPELLAEADRLGMWIVCPPPPEFTREAPPGSLVDVGPNYDSVLAWHLGDGLATQDLAPTVAAANQLRATDQRRKRPIICAPETDLWSYTRGQHIDLLSIGRAPLGTTFELTEYASWLRERPRLAHPGTPFWSTVQTQLAPAVRDQQLLFGQPPPAVDADVQSIRLLTYAALAAGARGIEFRSETSLENSRPTQLLQLALLNQELELAEPWAAIGSYVTTLTASDALITGAVLQTDKARLILPMRLAAGSQFVPKPAAASEITITIPGAPEAHNVYELSPAGLQPLKHRRVTGGVQITLEDFQLSSLLLMTPDPAITSAIAKRVAQMTERAADLQRELTARTLAEVEAVDARMPRTPLETTLGGNLLTKAKTDLAEADKALAANDRGAAFVAARRAMGPLEQFKRLRWEQAVQGQNSLATSPFVASFETLPNQLQLADKLRFVGPGTNRLAAGDCENLSTMMQQGWRHFEHPQTSLRTIVELSPKEPHAGRFSLHMAVRPTDPENPPGLVETAPVWITSAPVMAQARELLAIRGWIRVPTPIAGSPDGLLIVDSLTGESLAERAPHTKGWREFMLYRVAPRDGPVTVTFALTGLGEAWIDDVTISSISRLTGVELGQKPSLQPINAPRGIRR